MTKNPIIVVVAALVFSSGALGASKRPRQAPAANDQKKDQKSVAAKGQKAPATAAPRHDLSGT
jgi:hypothetical protein